MPVVDAAPLIYFGKADKLFVLKEVFGSVQVPPLVYREVVEMGDNKGFEEALRVKKEIGKSILLRHPIKSTISKVEKEALNLGFRLGGGEIEGVALCIDSEDKIFLSDDDDAKKFALNYGIIGRGSIYILLKSCKEGILTKVECAETFEEMLEKGFWVSPKIAEIFYRRLEEI
jgi:predicted nucleic acid-binding protein